MPQCLGVGTQVPQLIEENSDGIFPVVPSRFKLFVEAANVEISKVLLV